MSLRMWLVVAVALFLSVWWTDQAAAKPDAGLVRVTTLTPFEPGCSGVPLIGENRNSEVEPWLAVNPAHRRNMIGAWQQDRLVETGASGLLSAFSTDGGRSWSMSDAPAFSRCTGGNAQNGGDYERATDPWVTFGPDGDAYQASLSVSGFLIFGPSAILVSESRDGGRAWGPVQTLIRDEGPIFGNDKEAITADPHDGRFVYAVWTRFESLDPLNPLFGPFTGPTYFSRTTDGGETWETARSIFDTGVNAQTLANQIAVLPNGDLIDVFLNIIESDEYVSVIRSTDRGETWSPEIRVSTTNTIPVRDPRDRLTVRTGGLPEIAVDPRKGTNTVYLVWQDGSFDGTHNQIAFARSEDGGLTWTEPKRVSEKPDTDAFTPAIEVNSKGEVAVGYYDLTHDTLSSEALETDYWITASADGGDTFAARRRLTSRSLDIRTAPLTLAGPFIFGPFLGDYQGLTAAGRDFHSLFALPTEDASNRSDLFSAVTRWRTPDLRASSRRSDAGKPRPGSSPRPLATTDRGGRWPPQR